MAEFPADGLRGIAVYLESVRLPGSASICREAIVRYNQLSERCVMDRAEWSAEIGRKNQRIAELEGRLALKLMELGEASDPRLFELAAVDIRTVVTNKAVMVAAHDTRPLTPDEAHAAVSRYSR